VREQNALKKAIAAFQQPHEVEKRTHAERELEGAKEKVKRSEAPLNTLMDHEDEITAKTGVLKLEIEELQGAIQAMEYELDTLKQETPSTDIPSVRVLGEIFSGSSIETCHSELVLGENQSSVLIQEAKIVTETPEGEKTAHWRIQVLPVAAAPVN
jgi:hypothetical protein